jgi:hypothetical protein
MLGSMLGLRDVKDTLRRFANTQVGALAGIAFMFMAMAAIEYDELIAPNVSWISDAWTVAGDFSRKITSFTL